MTTISATEAARNFSEMLNRVRYRGEEFVIVRGGETVARLGPEPGAAHRPLANWSDLVALFARRRRDASFADDLEEIQRTQPAVGGDPWAP